jgi:hypothetical protein
MFTKQDSHFLNMFYLMLMLQVLWVPVALEAAPKNKKFYFQIDFCKSVSMTPEDQEIYRNLRNYVQGNLNENFKNYYKVDWGSQETNVQGNKFCTRANRIPKFDKCDGKEATCIRIILSDEQAIKGTQTPPKPGEEKKAYLGWFPIKTIGEWEESYSTWATCGNKCATASIPLKYGVDEEEEIAEEAAKKMEDQEKNDMGKLTERIASDLNLEPHPLFFIQCVKGADDIPEEWISDLPQHIWHDLFYHNQYFKNKEEPYLLDYLGVKRRGTSLCNKPEFKKRHIITKEIPKGLKLKPNIIVRGELSKQENKPTYIFKAIVYEYEQLCPNNPRKCIVDKNKKLFEVPPSTAINLDDEPKEYKSYLGGGIVAKWKKEMEKETK